MKQRAEPERIAAVTHPHPSVGFTGHTASRIATTSRNARQHHGKVSGEGSHQSIRHVLSAVWGRRRTALRCLRYDGWSVPLKGRGRGERRRMLPSVVFYWLILQGGAQSSVKVTNRRINLHINIFWIFQIVVIYCDIWAVLPNICYSS